MKQGDLALQFVPFRSGRKVSINNYYYLDQVCHFGIVNFGYLSIHRKDEEIAESFSLVKA